MHLTNNYDTPIKINHKEEMEIVNPDGCGFPAANTPALGQ